MILADVLINTKYTKATTTKHQKFTQEIDALVLDYQDTVEQFAKLLDTTEKGKRDGFVSLVGATTTHINEVIAKKIKEVNVLEFPSTFNPCASISVAFNSYNKNAITLNTTSLGKNVALSQPRTHSSTVFDIAEKMGLIIIPLQYANQEILKNEKFNLNTSYTGQVWNSVNRFKDSASKLNLNTWVMCPLKYYSLHENAKDMKWEFFVPSSVKQSFLSIKIILPMLTGMIQQITNLESKVNSLSTELVMIKDTLQKQQDQINRLQEEIKQQAIKHAQMENEKRELEARVEAQRIQQLNWAAFDPIAIAIPESYTDINTYTGNVLLGPAWGPEIDDVLIDIFKLNVSTRKNYIRDTSDKF